jgi:hypothetical protein
MTNQGISSTICNLKNKGDCRQTMLSHDMLMAMQKWKDNNLLTWRDYSRYFYNEFEYGVKI